MLLKKLKMDKIEEIFTSFLDEAEDGIKLGKINVKFHVLEKTSLNGTWNDVPILIVKDREELLEKIKKYVEVVLDIYNLKDDKTNIRKCLIYLFANACYEDFSNPISFIETRINFFKSNKFLNEEIKVKGIILKKELSPITEETPYIFKAYLKDNDIPTLSYGISKDTCYIYNIENKDNDLLILSLFLNEIYKSGISKIKVITCMPMREINCEMVDIFTDLCYIYSNIIIVSHPFEKDEYMHVKLEEFKNQNFKSLMNRE